MRKKRTKKISVAKLYSALAGLPLPANKKKIIAYARTRGQGDDVIHILDNLKTQKFERLADIFTNLGYSAKENKPPHQQ